MHIVINLLKIHVRFPQDRNTMEMIENITFSIPHHIDLFQNGESTPISRQVLFTRQLHLNFDEGEIIDRGGRERHWDRDHDRDRVSRWRRRGDIRSALTANPRKRTYPCNTSLSPGGGGSSRFKTFASRLRYPCRLRRTAWTKIYQLSGPFLLLIIWSITDVHVLLVPDQVFHANHHM